MAAPAEFDADSDWRLSCTIAVHRTLADALPRHGQPQAPLRLVGAEPDAVYVDVLTEASHHGAVPRHHGLNVPLADGDHANTMVHLRITARLRPPRRKMALRTEAKPAPTPPIV
jgi:hypothetical protein